MRNRQESAVVNGIDVEEKWKLEDKGTIKVNRIPHAKVLNRTAEYNLESGSMRIKNLNSISEKGCNNFIVFAFQSYSCSPRKNF